MYSTKKINDIRVKPYKGVDKRPYKYEDLLPHPYCNILIIGPKNTGKSQLSGTIILNCISNKSVFRIFSSTMEADHTTKKTIGKLEKRNIDVEKYDTINHGQLTEQLDQIKHWVEDEKNKKKLDGYKFRFPLVIYLWDDFRENFRGHPEIANFFTKNRHYRALNIVSSQNYKDISNYARRNTQVLILTKGLSRESLQQIYKEQPIHITFDKFWELYELAVEGKYNFLFCDLDNGSFRINFDEEIIFQ